MRKNCYFEWDSKKQIISCSLNSIVTNESKWFLVFWMLQEFQLNNSTHSSTVLIYFNLWLFFLAILFNLINRSNFTLPMCHRLWSYHNSVKTTETNKQIDTDSNKKNEMCTWTSAKLRQRFEKFVAESNKIICWFDGWKRTSDYHCLWLFSQRKASICPIVCFYACWRGHLLLLSFFIDINFHSFIDWFWMACELIVCLFFSPKQAYTAHYK